MVYIKLTQSLFNSIKTYIEIQQALKQIIKIGSKDQTIRYIPYKYFKQIAQKYNLTIHQQINRSDIVNDLQLKAIVRQHQRPLSQKKFIADLNTKHQRRLINKYKGQNSTNYYFQDNSSQSVKDLTSSISYGITFLFSFFMAGLTGYYFALFFLGMTSNSAFIVAIIFIIMTIIVETGLFIIKQDKEEKKKKSKVNYPENIRQKPFKYTQPSQKKTQ